MMDSLSDVLQKRHEDYETARHIMYNMHDIFGGHAVWAKQAAIKSLMSCKQKRGTPISDHMLKLIGFFVGCSNQWNIYQF